jgi:tetratricopeptide (TPR) repeat protein
MSRAVVLLLIALAGVFLAAGLAARWRNGASSVPQPITQDSSSIDPRVAYSGPYRNVRPNVAYVGDAVCLECHAEKAGFHNSAMGRSLVPIAQLAAKQGYNPSVHNPFEALNCRFQVERDGEHVRHRQILNDANGRPLIDHAMEVAAAIGSGHRGHSYFSIRDGFVFQTPISWYSQKEIWDKSPGFASGTPRPVVRSCLFCHCNRVEPVGHTINRYKEPVFEGYAIGCERCHGPGELHAKERRLQHDFEGSADTSIVHPGKLPPSLREEVCQQCHMEGEGRVERPGRKLWQFRPGLALHDFWSVFVPAREPLDERPAVSQVEQMYASRCFQASAGKLGCISCHDPHERIEKPARDEFYRARCLACHEQQGCSIPETARRAKVPSDNCIDCHMPRFAATDIVHTAMTDHRVPRAPGKVHHAPERRKSRPPFGAPLRFFREDELPPEQLQSPRELGIVLVQSTRDKGRYRDDLPLALRLIERALVDHPDDLELWEHKGTNLVMRRERLPEALAAFEKLLQLCPDHESALSEAAFCHQLMRNHEAALPYWQRVIKVNPEQENYRFNMAMVLLRLRRWQEALDAAEQAVRLDPFSARNRTMLALCLHKTGRKEQARTEFEKVRALKPPELEALEQQFEEETR